MGITKGTRVRLDHRGTGTVQRFVEMGGRDSVYAVIAWDNGDESYEWVHYLIFVKGRGR